MLKFINSFKKIKNHGTVLNVRKQGLSGGQLLSPWGQKFISIYPEPCSVTLWMSPRLEISQALCVICLQIWLPSCWRICSLRLGITCVQFVIFSLSASKSVLLYLLSWGSWGLTEQVAIRFSLLLLHLFSCIVSFSTQMYIRHIK